MAEKVKTHVRGDQETTAGHVTPSSRLRPIASTHDWRPCPLVEHGSQKRSKDKDGQHWSTLVESLDTSTMQAVLGTGFKNRTHTEAQFLGILASTSFSWRRAQEHSWDQQMPGSLRA